jgi:hypothetical protein
MEFKQPQIRLCEVEGKVFHMKTLTASKRQLPGN